jgi:hypothetical protein
VRGMSSRLGKVEPVLRPRPGCPICCRWDGNVVGDEPGKRSRQEVCPECGRGLPVRMVAVVTGLDQLWR